MANFYGTTGGGRGRSRWGAKTEVDEWPRRHERPLSSSISGSSLSLLTATAAAATLLVVRNVESRNRKTRQDKRKRVSILNRLGKWQKVCAIIGRGRRNSHEIRLLMNCPPFDPSDVVSTPGVSSLLFSSPLFSPSLSLGSTIKQIKRATPLRL